MSELPFVGGFVKTAGLVATVVIFGFGIAIGKACAPDPEPVLPAVVVVDSLEATAPAHDSTVAALKRQAQAANRKAEEARKEAAIQRQAADAYRVAFEHVVNSDTVDWQEAATLARNEADELRGALSLADAEARAERERANREAERADREEARRIEAERAAGQLANAIKDAEPKCGIGPLPCPSRTTATLIGAGTVLVAFVASH